MGAENKRLLVCETAHPDIRVARFIHPDMRDYLYDNEAIAHCALFQALRETALQSLAPGVTIVLNFGLIDWFPTAFYRFVLRVNEEIKVANCRLLMCCLPPLAKEAFELMGGERTFAGQVYETEARAVFAAAQASS